MSWWTSYWNFILSIDPIHSCNDIKLFCEMHENVIIKWCTLNLSSRINDELLQLEPLSLVAKQGQNKWKWVTNQSQGMREMKENEAQVSNLSDRCLERQKGQTLPNLSSYIFNLKVRILKTSEILRMKCEGLKHFELSDGRFKIVGSLCKNQNVFGRALKNLQNDF